MSLLFFPVFSFGQIIITEIMYDLPGSDAGREWIEVSNTTGSSVSLSLWKLFENGTNHNLVLHQGNENLPSGGSAIISDNPAKFLSDHPGFNGAIFDSSFSLSNTGETLAIRNDELEDIDSVSYLSDSGAAGDGESLALFGENWLAAAPSPGNFSEGSDKEAAPNPNESASSSGGNTSGETVNFPKGSIKTSIIGEKNILSGADVFFEAGSLGVKGEPLENARHLWNFGDGTILEGEKVLHNYIYPGEYAVFLEVSSENFTATDKLYVSVLPSNLSISSAEVLFIKLKNDSAKEINLSRWILKAGGKFFIIPENTYIRPNGEITFPGERTLLNGSLEPVNLLYPNGRVAYSFNQKTGAFSSGPSNQASSINFETSPSRAVKLPGVDIRGEIVAQASSAFSSSPSNLEDDPDFLTDEAPAQAKRGGLSKWIILLVSLILLSSFGLLYIQKDAKVEGFTIIE